VAEHARVEVHQLAPAWSRSYRMPNVRRNVLGRGRSGYVAAEGRNAEGKADRAAGAGQRAAAHEAVGGRIFDAAAWPEPKDQPVEEP
jgi:hypothetical protein